MWWDNKDVKCKKAPIRRLVLFHIALFFVLSALVVKLLCKRTDHHGHLPTFHLGHVFNLTHFLNIFGHPLKQLAAKIKVRHLTASEAKGDFNLIAIFKKLENITHFHIIVVRVRSGTKLNFFNLYDFLLLACFGFAFLLFVLIFSKIHDFTHGRLGIWGNFNQIQTGVFSQFEGALWADDTNIFAFCTNKTDFWAPDPVVHAGAGFARWGRVVRSAGYDGLPFVVVQLPMTSSGLS